MTKLSTEALDVQADLLRFYRSEAGVLYSASQLNMMVTDLGGEPGTSSDGEYFASALAMAETFAVTKDIAQVMVEAKDSLPSFRLDPQDLPSHHGYLHFEEPFVAHDRHGKPLVVKALLWMSMRMVALRNNSKNEAWCPLTKDSPLDPHTLMLVLLTDARDPRDHMHEDYLSMVKEWGEATAMLRAPLWSLMGGVWDLGVEPDFSDPRASVVPLLMTFFRFIKEPWVATQVTEPSERQARKRAVRSGLPAQVRVVCLRETAHTTHKSPGGTHVEYTHRWMVRAHWRNQWYPSEGRHAPRWIPAHVKGPDALPLVVKKNVFSVSR